MTSIAFMRGRFVAAAISGILLLATVISLATQQLNWGLDFTGGTLIELNYEQSADLGDIRTELASSGFEGAMVVSFGTDRDVLVRLPIGYSDAEGARMVDVLRQATHKILRYSGWSSSAHKWVMSSGSRAVSQCCWR